MVVGSVTLRYDALRYVTLQRGYYDMDRPQLGYAIIVNNVTSDVPGSREDTTSLVNAYKTSGFNVRHYFNCDKEVSGLRWQTTLRELKLLKVVGYLLRELRTTV